DKQIIIQEHETNWDKLLESDPDELKTHLTHLNTKLVNILNEKCQLTRKVNILLETKSSAQNKIDTLEDQVTNLKADIVKLEAHHEKVKEQFTREIDSLRQTYEDCLSMEEVTNLKQELYDVTIKYRSTLQSISDVLKHDPLDSETTTGGGGSSPHSHSTQIRQLEEKCLQFEKKLAVMVESEKSFQKFQTKLTEKYAESVSKVEYQNVVNKLRDCERQASQLRAENGNFLEMLNEAHSKLKQIELRKAYHEFEHDALQRCILELQCISDDKNTIGRLTQEIHSLHVNEIKNQDSLQTVQHSLEIAKKTSEELENHVEYLRNELALHKQIFNDKIRQLKSLILYLNKRFVGALPLLSEEIWSNQVKRLSQEKFQLMKCSRHQLDDTAIETASIDNLRVQLKSLSFAKTSVEKRLEVSEEVIAKYETLVNSLQADMINMEHKYEKLLLEAHNVEVRFKTDMGDRKLAEELENAIERKTLTHKRNLKLEAENTHLKEELEKLKQAGYRQPLEMSEINQMALDLDSLTEEECSSDRIHVKSKQRRTADLEKAVAVLKRVVDKLQAENKRLYSKQVTLVQEKEYTEKIQIELQKSQANYLDAMDRCSLLEAELKQARSYANQAGV
ncbi:hypothetical protein WDU94_003783, partial [Cyamophila willieti]